LELVAGVQLRIVIGASRRLHAWGVAPKNDLHCDGLAVVHSSKILAPAKSRQALQR